MNLFMFIVSVFAILVINSKQEMKRNKRIQDHEEKIKRCKEKISKHNRGDTL